MRADGIVQQPYIPITERTEVLLSMYFDIDLDKIEAEKRQMLDEQRKLNSA